MVCVPTVFYHTVDEYRGETSNCILFIQFWTSSGPYPVAAAYTEILSLAEIFSESVWLCLMVQYTLDSFNITLIWGGLWGLGPLGQRLTP